MGGCEVRQDSSLPARAASPVHAAARTREALAEQLVVEKKPLWLIGSPPYTPWCTLNRGINYPKVHPAKVQKLMAEARNHLEFVWKLYRLQLANKIFFVHERPTER